MALAGAATAGAGAGWSLIKFMTMTKVQWGIVGVLAVAAVSIPVLQNQKIKRLRQENEGLRIKTEDMGKLRQQNPGLAIIQIDSNELARLRKEQSDLLRLRGEVTGLRNRNLELADAVTAKPARKPPIGPFISPAQFNDAGLGTPEAAMQTFLWAGIHNKKDRMEQAADWGPIQKLMHEQRKAHDPDFDPSDDHDDKFSLDGLTNNAADFGGFQVLSAQTNTPNQVELEFTDADKEGGVETNHAILNRINDEWKVDVMSLAGTNTVNGSFTQPQPDGSETTNNVKFKVEETKDHKLVPAE
jgi:hypothetical protein